MPQIVSQIFSILISQGYCAEKSIVRRGAGKSERSKKYTNT